MPDTIPTPLRLTVADIADLYWVVARRVSNESQPRIATAIANLPGGSQLYCDLGDYPRAHLTTPPGATVEIDAAGAAIHIEAGTAGNVHHESRVGRVTVVWLTRAGTGPTIVGGGQ